MSLLKIEPNIVDTTGDFVLGDITVDTIHSSSGTVIDGIFEKIYTFPGTLALSVGTAKWWVHSNIKISSIILNIDTAPQGSSIIISILKNSTIVGTATLNANSLTSTASVNIAAVNGDYITVNVTQVGSSQQGYNLVTTFLYSKV